MNFRRLPVLAGPVLAGLLVLGGCAGAPTAPPTTTPEAAAPSAASTGGPAPCTNRLRPGAAGGATPLTLTPEVRAEIERLQQLPPDQRQAGAPEPALASRLAEVSARVERAARPCADR
jgi:hypothetical protein